MAMAQLKDCKTFEDLDRYMSMQFILGDRADRVEIDKKSTSLMEELTKVKAPVPKAPAAAAAAVPPPPGSSSASSKGAGKGKAA